MRAASRVVQRSLRTPTGRLGEKCCCRPSIHPRYQDRTTSIFKEVILDDRIVVECNTVSNLHQVELREEARIDEAMLACVASEKAQQHWGGSRT